MQWRYSVVQNVAVFASVLPVIAAWQLVDTLDWYPYFLSAAAGVALALALRGALAVVHARLLRRSAAFVAGEVGPNDAPGGLLLWLAPPLWGIALGLFANAYLDPSPASEHASEVLRRSHAAKGPGQVVLRGYRPGEAELAIHGNSRLVMRLSEGEAVTILARAGLFGWDRIEAITPRR